MAIRFPRIRVMPLTSEHLIWEGRPSRKVLLPLVGLASIVFLAIVGFAVAIVAANSKVAIITAIILGLGFLGTRPFLLDPVLSGPTHILTVRYQVTNQRVIVTRGLWNREVVEVDLAYFRATSVSQNWWHRKLGIGQVHLHRELHAESPSALSPLILLAVSDPLAIKELARSAIVNRRSELGIRYVDIL